jgi:phage baseplate assembly protein W
MARALEFPFQVSERGVAAAAGRNDVIRQQLEQLLMTMPGERVNRPDFGCGVQRLVFAGASPEAAAAAEYVIATAIRKYMAELIRLDAVRVTVDEAQMFIDILYTLLDSGAELAASFTQPLAGRP